MKKYMDYIQAGMTRDLPEDVLVNDYFLRIAKHLSSEAVAKHLVNTYMDCIKNDEPVAVIYKELFHFCPDLDQYIKNKTVFLSRKSIMELFGRLAWSVLNEWPTLTFPVFDAPILTNLINGNF